LSTTALIADAFILAGLLYIFGSEISIIAHRGIADVKMFNPRDFPLFIGLVFRSEHVFNEELTFIIVERQYSLLKVSDW